MLIKFCGITRQQDATLAAYLKPDFCGFIFHPKSPRHIETERARQLNTGASRRVGVFVRQNGPEILQIMEKARLHFAQLHGEQSLKDALCIGPERVIRVLWPARYANLEKLREEADFFAQGCAYFLLDGGASGGGSGQKLNWASLAHLDLPRPWLLAGGLDPENLGEAVTTCNPFGVDINSGVEEGPGIKSARKMRQIMSIIKKIRQTE